MAKNVNVSLSEELVVFVKENCISPSKVLQRSLRDMKTAQEAK